MAITVRELLTKWGFDVDTKSIDRFDQALTDAKTTVALIGAQALASAGSLFGLANSVSKTGDDFAKTASRIGINVETLQEYAHVAQLAGSSTQEMNGALESLTLGIAEARKGGGKLIEPLIRLNQLTGRDLLTNMGSADEMMAQLADTFAQMSDETEKAELANKIFGGSGLAMVNVLNQGSAALRQQRQEARDLGIVLSERAAKQSELFQDQLTRLIGSFQGVKNSIGVELMPIVISFMDALREWITLNQKMIKSAISTFLSNMADLMTKLVDLTRKMFRAVNGMILIFGGWENVLKSVIFLLLTLTGLKFLSALGNMALAIRGIVMAWRAVGTAALIAQAKMALIPLAVGAALAALFLIVDDLVAFFQGRDSLIGKIMSALDKMDLSTIIKNKLNQAATVISEFSEKVNAKLASMFDIPEPGPMFRDMTKAALQSMEEFFTGLSFDNLGEKLQALFVEALLGDNIVSAILRVFVNVFQAIGDALLIVIGGVMDTVIKSVTGAFEGLLDFSGDDGVIAKGLNKGRELFSKGLGFLGFGDDEESDVQSNLNRLGVSGPGQPPGLRVIKGGAVARNVTTTNNNSVQVDVNVPPGTTAKEGAALVEQGVTEALQKLARETQAATASNVER